MYEVDLGRQGKKMQPGEKSVEPATGNVGRARNLEDTLPSFVKELGVR